MSSTGYPTLDTPKSIRCAARNEVEKSIKAKWNGWGMSINGIDNLAIKFVVRVIAHNFYQSSLLNSVTCIVVDLGYQIVKKGHIYDLFELWLQQILENIGAIRKVKNTSCKFRLLLVYIFLYV